jgi:hypothetical protein
VQCTCTYKTWSKHIDANRHSKGSRPCQQNAGDEHARDMHNRLDYRQSTIVEKTSTHYLSTTKLAHTHTHTHTDTHTHTRHPLSIQSLIMAIQQSNRQALEVLDTADAELLQHMEIEAKVRALQVLEQLTALLHQQDHRSPVHGRQSDERARFIPSARLRAQSGVKDLVESHANNKPVVQVLSILDQMLGEIVDARRERGN